MMAFTDSPKWPPRVCAVTGWGPALANGRLLDTGATSQTGERIYLSDAAMEQIAPHFSLVPQAELEQAYEEARNAQAVAEALAGELDQAREALQAVHVLESAAAFKARKKPGPKKRVAA